MYNGCYIILEVEWPTFWRDRFGKKHWFWMKHGVSGLFKNSQRIINFYPFHMAPKRSIPWGELSKSEVDEFLMQPSCGKKIPWSSISSLLSNHWLISESTQFLRKKFEKQGSQVFWVTLRMWPKPTTARLILDHFAICSKCAAKTSWSHEAKDKAAFWFCLLVLFNLHHNLNAI